MKLKIDISLPYYWAKQPSFFNFFHRGGSISKNRSWEVQAYYSGWVDLFCLDIELDWYGYDHAGPRFELTIFGLTFSISFPDNRHWDFDEDCFMSYDNSLTSDQ